MTRSARRRTSAATPDAGTGRAPDPADLLAWYDRHRRVLPWRTQPGETADPYRVWLSEIMLQQTTARTVGPYFARFLDRFPTIEALAAAPVRDVLSLWAGLGYYARARNLHACAQAVVDRHAGRFPADETGLRGLPGVGSYTAAAIAAIAFDLPATPVDGNVERVVARLFAVEDQLPAAKPAIRALATRLTPDRRSGDFAQAMMDLGATLCTPRNPACALCPWNDPCAARRRGTPEAFPVKAPKREGRLRRGAALVAVREDDCVLLRTRPEKGLLGGMAEVPTSAWQCDLDDAKAFAEVARPLSSLGEIAARRIPGVVTHVFTHFPLELTVYTARLPERSRAPGTLRFTPLADLAAEALPTLMRKVLAHAGIETRPAR